jgi:hypothetical protein
MRLRCMRAKGGSSWSRAPLRSGAGPSGWRVGLDGRSPSRSSGTVAQGKLEDGHPISALPVPGVPVRVALDDEQVVASVAEAARPVSSLERGITKTQTGRSPTVAAPETRCRPVLRFACPGRGSRRPPPHPRPVKRYNSSRPMPWPMSTGQFDELLEGLVGFWRRAMHASQSPRPFVNAPQDGHSQHEQTSPFLFLRPHRGHLRLRKPTMWGWRVPPATVWWALSAGAFDWASSSGAVGCALSAWAYAHD